jgi:hypothetical protein
MSSKIFVPYGTSTLIGFANSCRTCTTCSCLQANAKEKRTATSFVGVEQLFLGAKGIVPFLAFFTMGANLKWL